MGLGSVWIILLPVRSLVAAGHRAHSLLRFALRSPARVAHLQGQRAPEMIIHSVVRMVRGSVGILIRMVSKGYPAQTRVQALGVRSRLLVL